MPMLTADERQAAIRACYEETYWRPCWPSSIMAIPLFDEGFVGPVAVPAFRAAQRYQALVVATNECESVDVGDLICFDIGRGEELYTVSGECYYCITEANVSSVDDQFWEREEQRASGLWVPV